MVHLVRGWMPKRKRKKINSRLCLTFLFLIFFLFSSSGFGFVWEQNERVAGGMLIWSNSPTIPTSLTKVTLKPDNAKVNEMMLKKVMKSLWQCILGYMGEIQLSYPAMLAREVLRMGIE